MNRLRAGYCTAVNPYSGRPYRVSLSRADAHGIVFFSKNMAPFMRSLDEVDSMGYPFVVHYTINGYPRQLERSVVVAVRSAGHVREIARRYGPRAAVWRYDTILFTSLTPLAFHLENFERLARSMRGSTDEVVVSFAQLYLKTRRNMDIAAGKHGFTWWDPPPDEKLSLLKELCAVAADNSMGLSVCGQLEYAVPPAKDAVCIDSFRLSYVAGYPIKASRKSHRKACSCHESRDIGQYDTCPHGCVYCYGTRDLTAARARYSLHDPEGEFLIPHPGLAPTPDIRSCRDLAGGGAS